MQEQMYKMAWSFKDGEALCESGPWTWKQAVRLHLALIRKGCKRIVTEVMDEKSMGSRD